MNYTRPHWREVYIGTLVHDTSHLVLESTYGVTRPQWVKAMASISQLTKPSSQPKIDYISTRTITMYCAIMYFTYFFFLCDWSLLIYLCCSICSLRSRLCHSRLQSALYDSTQRIDVFQFHDDAMLTLAAQRAKVSRADYNSRWPDKSASGNQQTGSLNEKKQAHRYQSETPFAFYRRLMFC